MPMGDRTGPEGFGPGTGRGAGFCSGYNVPGAYNKPGFGAGRRPGRGAGFRNGGRGFRGQGLRRGPVFGYRAYEPVEIPEEERIRMLQDEAEFLESRLSEIRELMNKKSEES